MTEVGLHLATPQQTPSKLVPTGFEEWNCNAFKTLPRIRTFNRTAVGLSGNLQTY